MTCLLIFSPILIVFGEYCLYIDKSREANQEDSMCQLFVSADPSLWQNVTRSIRIDGMVTSIRLENIFWFTLEEIAQRDQLSLSQMIIRLNHEALEAGHDLDNFTSFLRVCAMRYLHLQTIGVLSNSPEVSLASLNSGRILEQEKRYFERHQ
ncbi:ribbon-helix-helix domain-containing protein [Marinomonas fungiae]|uniref:Predicted DNA-binding protein, contains Ribbon-helix-helix (RHH) domain n=1 Tax=Marinomonas fungiae TaxID=1137284 RepID=A0A0K6INR7_9GAMM|nr:Predicted DNA-binding protein, contains Ribbon-helix-helix (RHH) domain [Marinomonas fungiae]